MGTEIPSRGCGSTAGVSENDFPLRPVSPNASGEGLPYAPEDWPNPGDNWSWKVGKRVANSGNYLDRYLYVPSRLQQSARKKQVFASKLSVEQFIRKEFPNVDVDAFFASFSWRVPSKMQSGIKESFPSKTEPKEVFSSLTKDGISKGDEVGAKPKEKNSRIFEVPFGKRIKTVAMKAPRPDSWLKLLSAKLTEVSKDSSQGPNVSEEDRERMETVGSHGTKTMNHPFLSSRPIIPPPLGSNVPLSSPVSIGQNLILESRIWMMFMVYLAVCTVFKSYNDDKHTSLTMLPEEIAGHSGFDSESESVCCKAGNKVCSSLIEAERNPNLAITDCHLCCSEPGFCRDCCCILCCKTAYGGYNFIKCEAEVSEGYICGHVAHMDCALRSYMAGTVGGSICLDAEYYCRCCDTRMDLVSNVTRMLQTCKSLNSWDEIEKILNIGVCILQGSQNPNARRLLNHVKSAMAKLKGGFYLEDIWKEEDNILSATSGVPHHGNGTVGDTNHDDAPDFDNRFQQIVSMTSDHQIEYLKLEDEIDRVLQALRRSQEFEYNIALERLTAQKNHLSNLYQQLDKEKSELARCTSSSDPDMFLNVVLDREDQIKQEILNLEEMEKVAKGFGMTSKGILKKHFSLEVED